MIDDSIPDGSELGVELASLLLEAREQINLLWTSIGTTGITPRQDEVLAGASFDVGGIQFQVVYLSAGIAMDLTDIAKGFDGQLVLIRAVNSNVTVKHNVAKIVLNGGVDYNILINDWLLLTNYGGDGDTVAGVWIEVSRTAWV